MGNVNAVRAKYEGKSIRYLKGACTRLGGVYGEDWTKEDLIEEIVELEIELEQKRERDAQLALIAPAEDYSKLKVILKEQSSDTLPEVTKIHVINREPKLADACDIASKYAKASRIASDGLAVGGSKGSQGRWNSAHVSESKNIGSKVESTHRYSGSHGSNKGSIYEDNQQSR